MAGAVAVSSGALCCPPVLSLVPAAEQTPIPRSPRVPHHGACRRRTLCGASSTGDGEHWAAAGQRATTPASPSTLLSADAVMLGTQERALQLLPCLKTSFLLPSPKEYGNHQPRVVLCVHTIVLEGSHGQSASLPTLPRCSPGSGCSSQGAPRSTGQCMDTANRRGRKREKLARTPQQHGEAALQLLLDHLADAMRRQ